MEVDIRSSMRQVLDDYLQLHHLRKTQERYAVLERVCGMKRHFTIEELGEALEHDCFRVSRATLYNTLKLFCKLRLVIRHNLLGETKYEVGGNERGRCHQVCSVCGAVREIYSAEIMQAVHEAKLKRFRRDGFAIYIYGICSSCLAKRTRLVNQLKMEKNKK